MHKEKKFANSCPLSGWNDAPFPQSRERRWGIGVIFALFFEALFVFLGMIAFTASVLNAVVGAWVVMFLTLIVAGVFTYARDMLRDWRRGL